MIDHCRKAALRLLRHGMMCRGYITRGSIYHTDTQFVGSGYQKAYERERQVVAFKREADERGTPFIEVDSAVHEYVETCGNECVKEMYSRMVKHDGYVAAIFPFQRLSHSFLIGPDFDPDKERRGNEILRGWLRGFRERVLSLVDPCNASAVRKAEHYVRALDAQLEGCDETDRMIDWLCSPFPGPRSDP